MPATPFRRKALILLAFFAGCASGEESGPIDIEAVVRAADIPADLAAGETAFNANCASCHGERALGTDSGPPLIHIYYEPSHHPDIAFQVAADRGVRAHHWSFGDMPPQPQVEPDAVNAIIAYVRFLQREAGIH